MRAVLQRVSSARVSVGDEITGSIGPGLLVLLGIHKADTASAGEWLAKKILQVRIFEDESGKMNRSVLDCRGELLIVSQFTLYGDVSKGTRPSFSESMPGEQARPFYSEWVTRLRQSCPLKIEEGRFGAMMSVALVNAGPVTIILDS